VSFVLVGCVGEDFYIPKADLVVNSVSLNPSTLEPGQSLTVSADIANEGGLSAGSFRVEYYYSTNNSYESSDLYLAVNYFTALPGQTENSISAIITVPAGSALGSNYIVVVIDQDSSVVEAKEDNNENYASVQIIQTVDQFPYFEDFESFNYCTDSCEYSCLLSGGWSNGVGGYADWIVDNNGTPSVGTGPSADYIPGTTSGKYLYVEASDNCYPNVGAFMYTPYFDLRNLISPKLEFAYHMSGVDMGSLSIIVSSDGGNSWSGNLWSVAGDQGTLWQNALIDLSAYSGNQYVQIRFDGTTGASFTSDMAIDYVRVYE